MIHVDRVSGALGASIGLGAYALGGPDALWFAGPGDPPTVVRVDPASGATVATIDVPAGTGCAVAGTVPDALFTSSCFARTAETRTFARIDPLTNTVVATTQLPATHGGNPVVAGGFDLARRCVRCARWLPFRGPGPRRPGVRRGAAVDLPPWRRSGRVDRDRERDLGPDEAGHRVLRYDIAS